MDDWETTTKVDDQVGFVRKVLGIVASQLTLTMAVCIGSSANPEMGKFFKKIEVALIGLFVLIASICTLISDKSWRLTVPHNYILLLLMTLAEAASVCAMTADLETVGVLITCGVFCVTLLCLFGGTMCVKDS